MVARCHRRRPASVGNVLFFCRVFTTRVIRADRLRSPRVAERVRLSLTSGRSIYSRIRSCSPTLNRIRILASSEPCYHAISCSPPGHIWPDAAGPSRSPYSDLLLSHFSESVPAASRRPGVAPNLLRWRKAHVRSPRCEGRKGGGSNNVDRGPGGRAWNQHDLLRFNSRIPSPSSRLASRSHTRRLTSRIFAPVLRVLAESFDASRRIGGFLF